MKRHRANQIGILLAVGLLCTGPARAADRIVCEADGKEESLEGTIIKDDYAGVTISRGQVKFGKSRDQIKKVIYGNADNDTFARALQAYEEGNFPLALKMIDTASENSMRALSDNQKPLFGQYILYYRAMCSFKLGEQANDNEERLKHLKAAREGFANLLSRVADTAFLFEASLADVQCLEQISPSSARTRYDELSRIFKQKLEAGRGLEWARKYIFMTSLGKTRIDMEETVRNAGQERKVQSLLADLKSLQQGELFQQCADGATRLQITQIESRALSYLKKYAELVKALESVIRASQKADDRDNLGSLYVQRGDAYYSLAKDTAAAEEKKVMQERALFDYLRADLLFALAKPDKGRINLNIADLLGELKTVKDWQKRGMNHLRVARQNGVTVADSGEIEKKLE